MAEVSVIGLGAMGSALARRLLSDGHRVTVWNRTRARADPLIQQGAVGSSSVAEAFSASPVVVICVDNYDVTNRVLEPVTVTEALAGRVLVQLSTGTPNEARKAEAWLLERGVEYLDGAILAYPKQIGTPNATIVVSGSESAFKESEPLLRSIAGNLSYLGRQVGKASAMDCAQLSFLFGVVLGFTHGVLVCEAENLRVDFFGSMAKDLAPVLGDEAKHLGEVIQTDSYENPEASLASYAGAVERLLQQAQDARIDSAFPAFTAGLFKRAITAGHADEEVASLIKVLRRGA